MFCRAFVTIALICAVPSAYSYSAGAPEAACGNMLPQHHVDPQQSTPPYKLLLSSKQLSTGKDESVHVTIQGNSAGDTIKGFLVEARVGDKPVGKFEVPTASKKYAQLLNCSGGSGVSKQFENFLLFLFLFFFFFLFFLFFLLLRFLLLLRFPLLLHFPLLRFPLRLLIHLVSLHTSFSLYSSKSSSFSSKFSHLHFIQLF